MNPMAWYHMSMNGVHDLADIDLNLLVAFDALAEAGHVTRAAAKLGVSQSALSHSLRRLRELTGDPLFTRAPGGVRATPRAVAMRGPVRDALQALRDAVRRPPEFDPAIAERRFHVAGPDLFHWLLAPALAADLLGAGPGIALVIRPDPPGHALIDALDRGDLDVAIVPAAPWASVPERADLVLQSLFHDDYRCFVRRDHPALRDGTLSLDAFLAADHLLVAPSGDGEGFVDGLLAARGLRRRVRAWVPSFPLAPRLLETTDLVLTAPTSLWRAAGPGVLAIDPPLPIPGHGLAALWHRRVSADPGHRWLRERLADVSREALSPSRPRGPR
jgi:DNA-binding transcriptional LysR family regulator